MIPTAQHVRDCIGLLPIRERERSVAMLPTRHAVAMASAALKLLARHPATRSVLRTTCVTQCRLCSHVHISSSDSGWQLREGERITKVGAVVNVALAGAKVSLRHCGAMHFAPLTRSGQAVAGWATGSSALLADAGHSLSDLVSDAVTLWAVRLSRKPPDHNHTYGHGKVGGSWQ